MSFIDIKDPKKRDAIVADYLATKKRIQQRNLNERAADLMKEEERNELFKPIVNSTEKSTAILHKELKGLKDSLKPADTVIKEEQTLPNKYDTIIKDLKHNDFDHYFSIQSKNPGEYTLGDKSITIDDSSNIIVDDVLYSGTDGLWSLIMKKKPEPSSYDVDDLTEYQKLAKKTNLANNPSNVGSGKTKKRPFTTYKYKNILSTFGDGIHFLPGDIKGLESKLNILLAEYSAGNKTSTRTEIVPILDELLRRRKISHSEYKNINNYLSK